MTTIRFLAPLIVAALLVANGTRVYGKEIGGDSDPVGGARPARLVLPPGYDPTKTYGLVVLLHGYGVNGVIQDLYLGFSAAAGREGFLVATPDGLLNPDNKRYWNATDACCDFYGSGVDDVSYIRDLIREIQDRYPVDKNRTYLFGHSNGAFLAHRIACEESILVAGIGALAGAMWNDATKCAPTDPVAVLTIHGTADETISYSGGVIGQRRPIAAVPYPSALDTIATWASRNRCGAGPERGMTADLESSLPGNETTASGYPECMAGGAAELWTLTDGTHIPHFNAQFLPAVFAFWAKHPRGGF